MLKGEFKQILFEIFSVLGLSEEEKVSALESFKGKFMLELLNFLKNDLPQEQQEWINNHSANSEVNQGDPKILEIQQTISGTYPEDKLYQKSKEVFRNVLKDYVQFMSSDLERDKAAQLNDILSRVG